MKRETFRHVTNFCNGGDFTKSNQFVSVFSFRQCFQCRCFQGCLIPGVYHRCTSSINYKILNNKFNVLNIQYIQMNNHYKELQTQLLINGKKLKELNINDMHKLILMMMVNYLQHVI